MGTGLENVLEDIVSLEEHLKYYSECKGNYEETKNKIKETISSLKELALLIEGAK
jgi:hypothetical protein